jgi:hypothetical protein
VQGLVHPLALAKDKPRIAGGGAARMRSGAHAGRVDLTVVVQAVRCALSPPVTAKEVPLTIRA